jgi:hypothetical protein
VRPRQIKPEDDLKITFLSLSSVETHYRNHQEAQRATWLGQKDEIYWLRGVPNISEVRINGVYLDCPIAERFSNILEKRIVGLRYAVENIESDYYVLLNTSTFVNIDHLKTKIRSIPDRQNLVAAARGFYHDNNVGETRDFLAGNLVILAKKPALALTRIDTNIWAGIADDIAITEHLRSEKFPFTYIERNDITDFEPFKNCTQHRIKSWEDPDITIARFIELNEIYSSIGFTYLNRLRVHVIREIKRYSKIHSVNRWKRILKIGRYLFLVFLKIPTNFINQHRVKKADSSITKWLFTRG